MAAIRRKSSQTSNYENMVRNGLKLMLLNSMKDINPERLANYLLDVEEDVRLFLMGCPIYEPMAGIEVLTKDGVGLVKRVNYKDLTADIFIEKTDTRYFKTAEEAVNYANKGDYDCINSNYCYKPEYPYQGCWKREVISNYKWYELKEINY